MSYDDIIIALNQTEALVKQTESLSRTVVRKFVLGKIRQLNMDSCELNQLKRELRNWDMHKHRWH